MTGSVHPPTEPFGPEVADVRRALAWLAHAARGDREAVHAVLRDVGDEHRTLETFHAIADVVLVLLRPDLNNDAGADQLALMAQVAASNEQARP